MQIIGPQSPYFNCFSPLVSMLRKFLHELTNINGFVMVVVHARPGRVVTRRECNVTRSLRQVVVTHHKKKRLQNCKSRVISCPVVFCFCPSPHEFGAGYGGARGAGRGEKVNKTVAERINALDSSQDASLSVQKNMSRKSTKTAKKQFACCLIPSHSKSIILVLQGLRGTTCRTHEEAKDWYPAK